MSKRLMTLLSILIVAGMLLAACGTKAAEPPPKSGLPDHRYRRY